ncbi:MAG: rhodanese-like domain-containing protein [Planctomycetota bacterium]
MDMEKQTVEKNLQRGLSNEESRALMDSGHALLIDVREHAEFQAEAISGALSHPLSTFDFETLQIFIGKRIPIFYCRTGIRSEEALQRWLIEGGDGFHLAEGIRNWTSAGFEVRTRQAGSRVDVMRQTQMVAGSLILSLSCLAIFVNSLYWIGSVAIGLGLIHAGASGTCGLATVISWLPWNRPRSCINCG